MLQDETGGNRSAKVGSLVHRELSAILQNKIADPRVGQVTITEVVMSRDLKHAKVYATSSESGDRLHSSILGLNRARSYIRQQLGAQLNTKYTPAVSFFKDEVPERSSRVLGLIDKASRSRDS